MRIWLVGWFNDRFGEVRTMQIGTVLLGLGLALMPLPAALTPGAPGMALFIVFLILVPVGTALLFPASTSLVSRDRKSTRLNSSHGYISYAVFCLKKKRNQ